MSWIPGGVGPVDVAGNLVPLIEASVDKDKLPIPELPDAHWMSNRQVEIVTVLAAVAIQADGYCYVQSG